MERKQLFRLCHVCDTLNESDGEILRCAKCGKGFLPLNYFQKLRAKAVSGPTTPDGKPLPNLFNPLNGLIVFW